MEPGKQSTPSASYATQHYESALKDFGSVDADKGLSDSEALRRRCTWGSNEFSKKEQEPLWVKFLDGFKDPLILLLFGAAAVSLLMGQIEDGVSIASVSCPPFGVVFPPLSCFAREFPVSLSPCRAHKVAKASWLPFHPMHHASHAVLRLICFGVPPCPRLLFVLLCWGFFLAVLERRRFSLSSRSDSFKSTVLKRASR
jgi:hypothetical protein